ncbi:MAG TPA: SCP2 sterol-binding domain-containing protein, partial [Polyangiaceae bacterium]
LFSLNDAPLPIVWDEDVAEAVTLCLVKGANGAFNVSSDEPLSPGDLARRGGLRPVRVPMSLARGAAAASHLFARLGRGHATDPAWLEAGAVRMIASSERAKRELGWRPRCPTAADVMARYQAEVPRRLDPRIALFFRVVGRASQGRAPDLTRAPLAVHVRLTGADGGDLGLIFAQGRVSVRRGIPRPPGAALILSTDTLRRLLAGRAEMTTAQMTGQLRLEGDPTAAMVLGGIITAFRAAGAATGIRGKLARRAATWFSHLPAEELVPGTS